MRNAHRSGHRWYIAWERADLGDEPRRRFPWAPLIVVLTLAAAVLSIFSYLATPTPAPVQVAQIQPAATVTVTATPQPVTNVSLSTRMGAVCIVPTSKARHPAVTVKVA